MSDMLVCCSILFEASKIFCVECFELSCDIGLESFEDETSFSKKFFSLIHHDCHC